MLVTQDHIDRGKGGNRSPVMLALRDHYNGKEVRMLDRDFIAVHDPDEKGKPLDEGRHLSLSWFVEDWLRRHKRGEQLSPMTLIVRYEGSISGTVYTEREIVAADQARREAERARQSCARQQADRQNASAARPWWKKLLGWPR